MRTGPPAETPKSFDTLGGLTFVPKSGLGVAASSARFWWYQKTEPCRSFVPLLEMVVMSPDCANSALLLIWLTRISAMLSVEGNSSLIGPLLRTETVLMPSIVTLVE